MPQGKPGYVFTVIEGSVGGPPVLFVQYALNTLLKRKF